MTTTNTATINSLTEALQDAFKLHGSDWNGAEEKSIDFSSADSIENVGDASAFQQWKDGLKNAKSALAKAIPHIVSAAEKSGNDGYIFFNIPKYESDDETAAQDVSDALMALIRACDQSDAEVAEEICQFIDEIEQSAAGGHTIASGWNHGTRPEDIELADVVNALDLGLEACSDESNGRTEAQREKAAFYLEIFRGKSSIADLVAEKFAADLRTELSEA